jgi:hypothetical protein
VLNLPADQAAILTRARNARYASVASDIMSTALWARGHMSVTDLAGRLLAPPDEVGNALAYAVSEGLIVIDELITVQPRRPPARPAVAAPQRMALRRTEPSFPLGAPPRAGIVTGNGDVVIWRHGEPVVLAQFPGRRCERALETAHGILVLGFGQPTLLVRPDGTVESLGTDLVQPALDDGGDRLAMPEVHYGRVARHRLHLIDLAGNARVSTPWEEDVQIWMIGMHGGTAYFTAGSRTMRWLPGSPPEPLGHEIRAIDRLTGTTLGGDSAGLDVTSPDGTCHRVAVTTTAMLAPGGEHLYAYRYSPPAVTIFDLAGNPQVHWLPDGSELSTSVPWGRPVWETADTLLIPTGGALAVRQGVRCLRLDTTTGALEQVSVPNDAGQAILTEPLL